MLSEIYMDGSEKRFVQESYMTAQLFPILCPIQGGHVKKHSAYMSATVNLSRVPMHGSFAPYILNPCINVLMY